MAHASLCPSVGLASLSSSPLPSARVSAVASVTLVSARSPVASASASAVPLSACATASTAASAADPVAPSHPSNPAIATGSTENTSFWGRVRRTLAGGRLILGGVPLQHVYPVATSCCVEQRPLCVA